MTFEQLGLHPDIIKGVKAKGYKATTPIQAQSIPSILRGKDVLGGAQTGTGKTAAFALPILEKLMPPEGATTDPPAAPRALILVPTRELAEQVGESFNAYGQFLNLRILKIYGGAKISPQMTALKKGCDIVVATPGRLKDHLKQKSIDLTKIKMLVLDEADRMLDMGFIKDIAVIIDSTPRQSQNLLFSATYSDDIEALAKSVLKNPVLVEVTKRNAPAAKVKQVIHYVDGGNRPALLSYLIKKGQWYQVLVFVKTKHSADRVASQLLKEGIPAAAIHSDKSQGARNRALKGFKSGDLQALVATDVAARGIDLHDLSHVVNFELPQIPEDYIHRIGRTGRAGKSGTAISLISHSEKNQLKKIEKILKETIPSEKVPGFEPKYDLEKEFREDRPKRTPKVRGQNKDDKNLLKKPERPGRKIVNSREDKPKKISQGRSQSREGKNLPQKPERPGRKNDSPVDDRSKIIPKGRDQYREDKNKEGRRREGKNLPQTPERPGRKGESASDDRPKRGRLKKSGTKTEYGRKKKGRTRK